MRKSTYDKCPTVSVAHDFPCAWAGWSDIGRKLSEALGDTGKPNPVLVVDCYPGTLEQDILPGLLKQLSPERVITTSAFLLSPDSIDAMTAPFLGDDPVFGKMNELELSDFFDPERLQSFIPSSAGLTLVYGLGASLLAPEADVLVYADLARWEAQLRFRRNETSNLGVENRDLKWSLQYKRAFFVDWRVADRHKKRIIGDWDFLLDSHQAGQPKLVTGSAYREGLIQTTRRPFRVTPFFDPGPWGGQWLRNVCDLDSSAPNYAWGFDCVPEENSLHLDFGGIVVESPSINLVFFQPSELLGQRVRDRFGDEFPIRFDFLDTMGGGNLSLQVHPLADYIRRHFGMTYTQDESYYILDAAEEATVYLGLREDVDSKAMAADLRKAQRGEGSFPDERYVNRWPAAKHDHFLIPAGTVHCSGSGAVVLEISATPYIFTFKMWDWNRLGLDGLPRPVHLDHALANIQWERKTGWVREHLVNAITPVQSGDGWREEHTGLDSTQFIETRRHWFTKTVDHHTNGGVNVLNLVEGEEVIVESPDGAFPPLVIHYAETFIIPAAAGAYTIRPNGASEGKECATLKAFVRT